MDFSFITKYIFILITRLFAGTELLLFESDRWMLFGRVVCSNGSINRLRGANVNTAPLHRVPLGPGWAVCVQ